MSEEKVNPLKVTVVKFVILFSLLIISINTIIIIYRGVSSYYKQYITAKDDIDSLTRTLSDHTELTFLAVDVVLQRAVEKHQSNLLFGRALRSDTANNIISWVDQTPQISAMFITDKDGNLTDIYRKQGYKLWMEGRDNVSLEKYFQSQIDEVDAAYIGRQQSFIKDHNGFIIISRRLNALDGSFDGIVLAAINVDYLGNFYNSIIKGKKTKVILKTFDAEDLMAPESLDSSDDIKFVDDAVKKSAKPNEHGPNPVELFSYDKAKDSERRIVSVVNLPAVGMKMILVAYGNDILENFYSERFSDGVFYIIFILFVFVVGFFSIELAKKVQKLRVSEKKALAASKAKSDFLANMSHELRTPLNAIIGFSEMLSSQFFGTVNDKQKERLKDINSCGNHLLSLINDILEFSKGQAGKIEIKPEEVSFSKLVNESVRIFDERSSSNGVNVVTNIPSNLPYIFVDRRKIKQILINLISNSVKFSERGDIVEVSATVNAENEFIFKVKDTGIGMREEDIPKAFSAFGQVHNDATISGTGLGLPLCKIFVELHKGNIEIKSKFGVGTEVIITLPNSVIVEHPKEI